MYNFEFCTSISSNLDSFYTVHIAVIVLYMQNNIYMMTGTADGQVPEGLNGRTASNDVTNSLPGGMKI
jgi:polyphosphate kinase